MSKTHYVNCTINNTTSGSINYVDYSFDHGKFYDDPISVTAGQNTQVFSAGSSEDLYGITGYVQYTLPDGCNLYLMFNNPYTHQGTGSTGNQWFYACIDKYSKYSVVVDSSSFLDPVNPMSSDTILPTVSVYLTSDMVSGNIPNPSFSTPTGNNIYINVVNNMGAALSLNSMTNGYNSPPISEGNPPFVAETIPATAVNGYTLALMADGGPYGGEASGIVYYNMPDGSVLSLTWSSSNDNQLSVNAGGTDASQVVVEYPQGDSTSVKVTIGNASS